MGSYVRYEVTASGWDLRAATKEEVDTHYETSWPSHTQVPERDLTVTEIKPLSEISFNDWDAFGVKAANVAVLVKLALPEGTVPDGFAIPFYFYDEFMKANGFYDRIEQMLADSDFQTDFDVQDDMLDDLRDDIEDADSPQWIIDALATMNEGFPEGINCRYRSSTNNEDLPGFNGAGLYDSKSQKPDEDEDDGLDKSLKEVYASLWNFRAFTEREFHRIDHLKAAMGILVHPSYQDELANGVAVSFDPFYDGPGRYYVNTQVGEDLVTNPEAHSVPEEILLFAGGYYVVLSTSNLVDPGELLMSYTQLRKLRDYLTVIHDHFEGLYNPAAGEPFAMEIEFKITSDDVLAIKQARPWVFGSAAPVNEAPTITTPSRTTFSYRENGTGAIYTFRATGPEGGTISWTPGGADGSDFIIEEGTLKFAGSPDYESPAGTNGNEYLVTVQARDGQGNTASLPVTVTVTDVNEGPEISGLPTLSFAENRATDQVLATYSGSDPEEPGTPITRWSTSGTDGGDFVMNEQGELRFRYIPDYERPADSNRDNEYVFTVRASDGRYYGYLEVMVTVTPVNEPPTITTASSSATGLRQSENRTSRLYTYRATDPEGSTITWSVGGIDGRFFTINERGEFSFSETSPPDYDLPGDSGGDNLYNVLVQVRDAEFNTASLDVTVTVTDVNEGPSVTSGGDSFIVQENQDWSGASFTASDPEGETISRWSLGGRDGGDFTISEDGVMTFRRVPDYERPDDSNRDNLYEAEIRPDDGRYYGSHDVTVTVGDVNEITGPATLDRSENFEGVLAIYRATDQGDLIALPGWRLTGTDSGDFTVSEQGELTFRAVPDHERPADSNRDNEYLFAVHATDGRYYDSHDVTITVTPVNEPPTITTTSSSATVLRQNENQTSRLYTYRATDPERGTITWSAGGTDGRFFTIDELGQFSFNENSPPNFEIPGDSGGDNVYDVMIQVRDEGFNTASLPVTVTVREVNEGPEVSGRDNYTVPENGDLSGAFFTAVDPEGAGITGWSLSGTDGGDFTISENGELTFRNVPNYESPADSNSNNEYLFSVRASDGRYYGYFNVTVTVEDVNEPPAINTGSRTEFTFRENGKESLYTYRAADPERGTITWSVSGTDRDDFAVSETGVLTFSTPPNYEIPADSDRDNDYEVTMVAADNGGLQGTLEVTVTDVNEGPEISGQQILSFNENGPRSSAWPPTPLPTLRTRLRP